MRTYLTGLNAIENAFKAKQRTIHRIFLQPSVFRRGADQRSRQSRLLQIKTDAKAREIEVIICDSLADAYLKTGGRISKGAVLHQGILADVESLPIVETSALAAWSREDESINFVIENGTDKPGIAAIDYRGKHAPVLLALDGITDDGNLGAILRTAYWYSVPVVLSQSHSAGLTPFVYRTSAGAAELRPPWGAAQGRGGLHAFLKRSRQNGWKVYTTGTLAGLDKLDAGKMKIDVNRIQEGSSDLLQQPSIVVFGSEHQGVRHSIRWLADGILHIPRRENERLQKPEKQKGTVESLNVSVAAAILMHEFCRNA